MIIQVGFQFTRCFKHEKTLTQLLHFNEIDYSMLLYDGTYLTLIQSMTQTLKR